MPTNTPELAFWKMAEEQPGHIAVVDPDGRNVTAGELLASANRIVHALRAMGLQPGDAIAVVLANSAPVFELYMACVQAGFYLTPISGSLSAPEIAYIVQDCGAKAIVCSERYADVVRTAADSLQFPAKARFVVGSAPGFSSYEAWKSDYPSSTPDKRRTGASMTYSSGTTGRPKGVRRPLIEAPPEPVAHANASFLMLFGIQPRAEGVHLVVAPLYHTAVLNFSTNHLHMGHTVVIMDRFTPEGALERMDRYKVTTSHLVPTHFHRMLALPPEVKSKFKLASLRTMIHSAAPCPVDTKRRMLEWWGPVIYEYYAASEGGGTTATPQDWLAHPGTVGKAWPISQIKILDDEGNEKPVGEPGTVYMSMGNHKFEYHKDQQKTQNAWRGSFFTVGDVGYLDKDGFLFLCDRKIDMIISGGVNIYPAEIEAALLSHSAVADAAVFGIPDDDWGEQVMAVLEVNPGYTAGPALVEQLQSFCKERLAGYKIPKRIEFTEALPRDANGKLHKRKLRDPFWVGRSRAI
jgi:long-chain acyl-CoA synthetase